MILEKFRLDGKVAVVTGGTRGIGLAIAKALGEAGARVIISARTSASEAAEVLTNANVDFEFIEADMREEGAADELTRRVIKRMGRLDILVNNAGVAIHGDSGDFDDETWRKIMSLNVDAVFRSCRAALARCAPREQASFSTLVRCLGSFRTFLRTRSRITARKRPFI